MIFNAWTPTNCDLKSTLIYQLPSIQIDCAIFFSGYYCISKMCYTWKLKIRIFTFLIVKTVVTLLPHFT